MPCISLESAWYFIFECNGGQNGFDIPLRRYSCLAGSAHAVKMVYGMTDSGAFVKDFGLRDQLRRAVISVMANIAEGFDCDSKVEFARFPGIARRSAVEVQSLLYAGLDLAYISEDQFKAAYDQMQKTKALVGGFKNSLNKRT